MKIIHISDFHIRNYRYFEEYDKLQQSPNNAAALPIIKIMTGSDIDIYNTLRYFLVEYY